MKKYFCMGCGKTFEAEQPGACPHCKGIQVTDEVGLGTMMKSWAGEVVAELKKPIESLGKIIQDNGVAGSGMSGEKSIVKTFKDQTGRNVGWRYMNLGREDKSFFTALQNICRRGFGKAPVEKGDGPHGANEGVGSEGAYLVPGEQLATQVIEVAYDQSIFLPRAFVYSTNQRVMKFPKLAQKLDPESTLKYFPGILFKWMEEAKTKSAMKPEWEQIEYAARKFAALMPVTDELLDDAVINFANYISGLMARYYPYFIDDAVLKGNGAAKPLGIIPDPNTLVVARAGAGAVVFADMVNMWMRMNSFFTNPIFLMSKAVAGELRQEVDTYGLPIWRDSFFQGIGQIQAPLICGCPVIITDLVSALGTAGDVVLCDPKYYGLIIRQGLTYAESDHFYFDTDEKALRWVGRCDGKEMVHEAFVILGDAQGT